MPRGPALILLAVLAMLDSVPPTAKATQAAASDTPPGGQPWILLASRVRMDGLTYHGVVTTVVAGRPVPAMRFTARSVLITDLTQLAPEPAADLRDHQMVSRRTELDRGPSTSGNYRLSSLYRRFDHVSPKDATKTIHRR